MRIVKAVPKPCGAVFPLKGEQWELTEDFLEKGLRICFVGDAR